MFKIRMNTATITNCKLFGEISLNTGLLGKLVEVNILMFLKASIKPTIPLA